MSDQAPDYQALANLLKLDADIMENRGGRGQGLVREIREAVAALRQAASLQVEVERWKEQSFRPLGDNHHSAALCPYCSPEEPNKRLEAKLTRYEDAAAVLRQTLAQLREDVPLSMLEDIGGHCLGRWF